MWRMLQQLFSRKPRRSVIIRLRLQVESLENRLVPSSSTLGGLLMPPALPPTHAGVVSGIKVETKMPVHHLEKNVEIGLGSAIKSETKQAHLGKKVEVDLGSAKSETKQAHLGKKVEVGSGSAIKSL